MLKDSASETVVKNVSEKTLQIPLGIEFIYELQNSYRGHTSPPLRRSCILSSQRSRPEAMSDSMRWLQWGDNYDSLRSRETELQLCLSKHNKCSRLSDASEKCYGREKTCVREEGNRRKKSGALRIMVL